MKMKQKIVEFLCRSGLGSEEAIGIQKIQKKIKIIISF